jgi:hypothetical protein
LIDLFIHSFIHSAIHLFIAFSLNRQRRLRELLRIAKENQDILKRITSSRPMYDHVQWERDWHNNLQLMDQISAFPRDWWQQDQV